MSDTTKEADFKALRGTAGFVSGDALAHRLDVSRTAVWKHVDALKRAGYQIESVRGRGYRLRHVPDRVEESAVREHLATRWLGRRLVCIDQTGSTNSDAAELARRNADDGTVVIANSQRAGRGRLGRSWVSAAGVNLYMSVLLRPTIVPAAAPQLSLVAGLAVAGALERERLSPRIKWPNDVLLGGRKVCGILTEIEAEADRVRFVVVGIGVNLNATLENFPPELHGKATSVHLETGRTVARARFAASLLGELERCYESFSTFGFRSLVPEWNRRAALIGSEILVSGAGAELSGRYMGIDDEGALLLEEEHSGQRRRVLAGDVTLVGGYGQ